jgi:EAL domain-containing protein (putative c-di-GMP-specific phosphodiesterase class I)/ActR/RegA family two-component response regulator
VDHTLGATVRAAPILVVEDDITHARLIERVVRKAGLQNPIQAIQDGEEAVSYLSGADGYRDRRIHPLPVLVLLDLHVPSRSGLEILAWKQEQPELIHVPVVMLSGSTESDDINRAFQLGAASYLVKPVAFDALIDAIGSLALPWVLMTSEGRDLGMAEAVTGLHKAETVLRNVDAVTGPEKRRGTESQPDPPPEFHMDVASRVALVDDLQRAIERGEFMLHYQPVVALQDGRFTGAEALIRWVHPDRGMVSPAEFIPLAEETGLVIGIDRWVLREACRQARAWQEQFPADPPLGMHVNVSARALQDTGLVADVQDALEETGLSPASLTLELTESVLLHDTEAAIDVFRELRGIGVRLAIDDFGMGFSSLSYLRRLPVDEVKIDRSFVTGVATGTEEWTLARGIIRLVHSLGLETVAEGVERADQVAHLRTLGCRLAQGYYFARPMDVAAITGLLEERFRARPEGRPQGSLLPSVSQLRRRSTCSGGHPFSKGMSPFSSRLRISSALSFTLL